MITANQKIYLNVAGFCTNEISLGGAYQTDPEKQQRC